MLFNIVFSSGFRWMLFNIVFSSGFRCVETGGGILVPGGVETEGGILVPGGVETEGGILVHFFAIYYVFYEKQRVVFWCPGV